MLVRVDDTIANILAALQVVALGGKEAGVEV